MSIKTLPLNSQQSALRLGLLTVLSFMLFATAVSAQNISVSVERESPSCFGGDDGSATLLPTGGTPPYSYEWSNGQTTATATSLMSGFYAYTVSDTEGNSREGNFVLLSPAPIVASANSNVVVTCFGSSDGSASVSATGGTPPYTYEWSNGETTASISGLTAGPYAYTVTDANGCTKEGGLSVLSLVTPLVVSLERTLVDCFGDSTGTASLSTTGGTPPYSYSWSNGATDADLENLPAGVYGYTVTDANGCTKSGDFSIIEPCPILPNAIKTDITCFGDDDGTASLDPQMGTPPFTILWSTGDTTRDLTNLTPGPYSYTITDANGCEEVGGFSIVTPWPIIPNLEVEEGDCGGSASLDPFEGTPPFTFEWSTGDTSSSITGLDPGEYSYTITDANLCIDTGSFEIGGTQTLSCQINVLQLPTQGQSNGRARAIATAGTPPYTYLWSNGQTTATATQLSAGFLGVTITDANGCESICSIDLTPEAPDPCIPLTNPGEIGFDQVLCGPGNTPATLVNVTLPSGGSGTIEYLWMKSTQPGPFNEQTWTPLPNSGSASYAPGPIYETTYFARCARRAGCEAYLETNIVTIEVGTDAIADISGPDAVCANETASFSVATATPDAQITWNFTGPATPSTVNGRNALIAFTSFGQVSVTVTVTENGCTATNIAYLSVLSDSSPFCLGFASSSLPTQLVAYPNPVSGQLNVELPYDSDAPTMVDLFNANGQRVIQTQVQAGLQQMQLDLSTLPAGFYLLRATQGDRSFSPIKVNKF